MDTETSRAGATVLKFPSADRAAAPSAERPAAQVSLREPLWRDLVGAVLRAERTDQGRTLGQVAERAGISPQYLSEVERGRKEPSSEMLAAICGALGLRLGELLGRAVWQVPVGGRLHSFPTTTRRPTGPVLLAG